MTTTDDRPAVTCPSWCAECQQPDDDGTRVHFTPIVSLPGDDPEDMPTLDELSRVWALADNNYAPTYCDPHQPHHDGGRGAGDSGAAPGLRRPDRGGSARRQDGGAGAWRPSTDGRLLALVDQVEAERQAR